MANLVSCNRLASVTFQNIGIGSQDLKDDCLFVLFEAGSHYVALAGLELSLSLPPSAGIKGKHHHICLPWDLS